MFVPSVRVAGSLARPCKPSQEDIMSRGTVIAGISIDLVNTTSSTLYPSIKNLLAGSYNVPEYSVTLNWQITQAPDFSLITQNHADVPAVNLPGSGGL